jgi:hypothetical protein
MVTAFDGFFAAAYKRATIEVLGFPPLRQEKRARMGHGALWEKRRGGIAALMNCGELGGLTAMLLLVQLNMRGESP